MGATLRVTGFDGSGGPPTGARAGEFSPTEIPLLDIAPSGLSWSGTSDKEVVRGCISGDVQQDRLCGRALRGHRSDVGEGQAVALAHASLIPRSMNRRDMLSFKRLKAGETPGRRQTSGYQPKNCRLPRRRAQALFARRGVTERPPSSAPRAAPRPRTSPPRSGRARAADPTMRSSAAQPRSPPESALPPAGPGHPGWRSRSDRGQAG